MGVDSEQRCKRVIVTGMSGAGKSVVLRTLEDSGFFCIDNLPAALLAPFFEGKTPDFAQGDVALGLDIRGDINLLVEQIAKAREQRTYDLTVIFLTATTTTLLNRFSETRRQHPLGGAWDLREALDYEKRLLMPLELLADHVIDTDQLTIHQLRAAIRSLCTEPVPMTVMLASFGFKYGVPPEYNFVFDVRSLPNPYFVPALRHVPGTDPVLQEYLFAQEEVKLYWHKLTDFFTFSLDNAHREGRFFVSIAIGCTGGRHRSVVLVEKLAQLSLERVHFVVKHRDIEKEVA